MATGTDAEPREPEEPAAAGDKEERKHGGSRGFYAFAEFCAGGDFGGDGFAAFSFGGGSHGVARICFRFIDNDLRIGKNRANFFCNEIEIHVGAAAIDGTHGVDDSGHLQDGLCIGEVDPGCHVGDGSFGPVDSGDFVRLAKHFDRVAGGEGTGEFASEGDLAGGDGRVKHFFCGYEAERGFAADAGEKDVPIFFRPADAACEAGFEVIDGGDV